jgi:hypothetical protein
MTTNATRPPDGDEHVRRGPLLRTLPEAAALLRTPPATLRYWRHLGTGPRSFKIGRRVMYDEVDLYLWITEQRSGSEHA